MIIIYLENVFLTWTVRFLSELEHVEVEFAHFIKAAIINLFILTMDQITMCNMKGVTHNDEPTGNYHLTLLFPSTLLSILVPFSLLFWF